MFRNLILASALLVPSALAFHWSSAQSAPTLAPIVGSWQLTFVPTSPTAAVTFQIPALATFTSDGTAIASGGEGVFSSLPDEKHGVRTTQGHGIWQQSPAIGHLFVQLISFTTNANGTLHAKRDFNMTITLNAANDRFTGGYSVEALDSSGSVITNGMGTVSGQLIPHPLLP